MMDGNRDLEEDGRAWGKPLGTLSIHAKKPRPWDLYRGSILKIAEEELPRTSATALIERLENDVESVWRDSPTALLAIAVARYKMNQDAEARSEFDDAWVIWEGLLDAEDPQTDTPVEILLLLRDLMRATGRDAGSSIPNHFRIRPAYQWLCSEYGRWYATGEEWKPGSVGEDPLWEFSARCLARADRITERARAREVLDPECTDAPPRPAP